MTSSSRRTGFRLPWTTEEGDDAAQTPDGRDLTGATDATPSAEKPSEPNGAAAATIASAPTKAPAHHADAGSAAATPAKAATNGAQPTPKTASTPDMTDPSNNPFLHNLVEAMRHVAEETRSKSVVELRASVDDRIRELRSASEERAGAMRKLAEDEVAAIGAWEETEIERVRAEAKRRSEERRARLDTEVAEDGARTEREIDQTKQQATAYETELDAFLAKLAEIRDPAEFVATAQRMPAPPIARSDAAPADDATTVRARLAALGVMQPDAEVKADDAPAVAAPAAAVEDAVTVAPAEPPAAPEATSSEPAETPPAAPAPAPVAETSAETATSVVVKGLGSFGAITSFKQSLERASGIRSVALSLGPTGEFVYRATHASDLDLAAALASIEEGSTVERQADGSLRVTIGRPR